MTNLRTAFIVALVSAAALGNSTAYAQEGNPTTYWDVATSGTSEFAAGIAIGADSRPVVIDTTCSTFGTPGCQARAVKYNSDTGAAIWTYVDVDGGPLVSSEAAGIAIGADGNPILAFTECDDTATNCQMVAVELNGTTGAKIWRAVAPAGSSTFAKAVSIGADGHAVVAGASCTGAGNSNCVGKVIKFNGTSGAIIWNVSRGTNYQMLFGVSVVTGTASTNNVIVTGVQCAATTQTCNFVTSQLSAAAGAQVANVTYNSSEPLGYFSEVGWGVRIGQDADPVVTGVTCLATGCDFRTIKYSSIALSTSTTFNVTYNSGGTNNDGSLGGGVAVANDNRPVIAGSSCSTDYPNCVGRIRKLTTSGTQLWNVAYGGATTSVQGIATGPDANPVVAGYECTGADCSSRITKQVLQYTTATGSSVAVAINGDRDIADGARVTFPTVTTAGTTQMITRSTGPAAPAGITFLGSRYFQFSTTANASTSPTVCLNYGNIMSGTESQYELYRRNNANTAWVQVTTSQTTSSNRICGSAAGQGLGLYAIGRP
jgi:hypothetical protein